MRILPHIELSYCTNVHPGEGVDELNRIIEDDLSIIKKHRCPHQDFGTGLRLGAETVYALHKSPNRLQELKISLEREGLYVFSVNGFPYGDFAAPHIKEEVYEPGWSTLERVRYTLALAKVMTELPGTPLRTISTVAGGFVPQPSLLKAHDDEYRKNFGILALGLAELEEETGVSVRLAIEPEPWTRLESIDQAIPFFREVVWPSSPYAEKHIGLCYDTCHQALAFEDPHTSWQRLREVGIPVYKVQISNALRLSNPQNLAERKRLLSFAEPRYLHQVTAMSSEGKLLRALDLNELSEPSNAWLSATEWRCHFHVPIWWDQESQPDGDAAELCTTSDHWRGIAELIKDPSARSERLDEHPLHVEVETYSWHVLPSALKSERGLHAEILRELETLTLALLI